MLEPPKERYPRAASLFDVLLRVPTGPLLASLAVNICKNASTEPGSKASEFETRPPVGRSDFFPGDDLAARPMDSRQHNTKKKPPSWGILLIIRVRRDCRDIHSNESKRNFCHSERDRFSLVLITLQVSPFPTPFHRPG